MPKCLKCQKEFKLNTTDSLLRNIVSIQAKMFPGLKEAVEEAKDFCNDCWKAKVKPIAEGFLKEKEK